MMFVENNYWELLIAGLFSWIFIAEIIGARTNYAVSTVKDKERTVSQR